jgi:hypothetical protein
VVTALQGRSYYSGSRVLLQKPKSATFDGCNPLKYRDTIFDSSVKNPFLHQSLHVKGTTHSIEKSSRISSGHVKKNLLHYLYISISYSRVVYHHYT